MADEIKYFLPDLRAAWWAVLLFTGMVGAFVWISGVDSAREQRLFLLQAEAQRSSLELTASTLNGNLMGSISLLGLIDPNIKNEVTNGLVAQHANTFVVLSSTGNAYGAEGVFLVGEDGIVKTSWDKIGKPSTGLDVRFRPYYQMAVKGASSVYAAISMARGDRSLYFTAPVYAEHARASVGVGAVVARTNLDVVDRLLKSHFDNALLLSPQGVVFASTEPAWQGMLAGEATPERLKAIRELKQFGALFEKETPKPLPLALDMPIQTVNGMRHAVANVPVKWNDPTGDWHLVALENLDASVSPLVHVRQSALAMVMAFFLGWIWVNHLRGRREQLLAAEQLRVFAEQQRQQADFRGHLTAASARLQRCDTMASLVGGFFAEAREVLGVVQGVVYVQSVEDSQTLTLVGTCACAEPPEPSLKLGHGLLGQCAIERRTQWIASPSEREWSLRSGLGNTAPAGLWLAPLVVNDTLIGVLELALLHPPREGDDDRLNQMTGLLTINLDILRRNLHTAELLEATQVQAEAMRVQAEELAVQKSTLQATEAWYGAIIESAPDGLLVIDEQGCLIMANADLLNMFGYSAAEVLGQPIEMLLPASARVKHVGLRTSYVRDADEAAADRLSRRTLVGVRKDGVELLLEIGLARLPSVGQHPACVCAAVRDVTERKGLQDRMAALEERGRLILEAVGDGILGLDTFGKVTFANSAASSLLGFAPNELLGHNLHELVHHHHADGSDFPREQCRMYQTTVDGLMRTVDDEVLWRKDGSSFAVEYATTPVRKDGRIDGTVVVFRDITQRKAAENAMQEALQVRVGVGA